VSSEDAEESEDDGIEASEGEGAAAAAPDEGLP
jgi:hypothetical protein